MDSACVYVCGVKYFSLSLSAVLSEYRGAYRVGAKRKNQENYHWLFLSAGTFHCFGLMYLSDFSQTKFKAWTTTPIPTRSFLRSDPRTEKQSSLQDRALNSCTNVFILVKF